MDPSEVKRWGVDFGNVLVKNIPHNIRGKVADLLAAQNFSDLDDLLRKNSALVPDAIEGLKTLVTHYGPHNVWIVSRAAGFERTINRRLLTLHRFEEHTGLLEDHIIFVDRREEKAGVCLKLGIQGHIDDRGEVLSHLVGAVPLPVWFAPTANDIRRWSSHISPYVLQVNGWSELLSYI